MDWQVSGAKSSPSASAQFSPFVSSPLLIWAQTRNDGHQAEKRIGGKRTL